MSVYQYKARDAGGNLMEGVVEAEDETAAASNLESSGLTPLTISPRSAAVNNASLSRRFFFKKVSRQEVLIFTRQLATLISTGVPLIQSLENVSNQTANPSFKQVINEIINALRSGVSFSESLLRYPAFFPNLYVSMVKVGETGGLLDKVLVRLAELSTQDIDLRSHLRSVLIYPLVLAVVAFLIVNFVLVGVLPKFVTIFESSQASIPIPTRFLLFTSHMLRSYWWLGIIAIILGWQWFRSYYRTAHGRLKFDTLILRLPLFGPLILRVMVCRFSRSIAALTKSGIPILNALEVVESTISNRALSRMLEGVRTAVSRGQSLTEPFAASGLFPPMVIQLINTGERTGRLDDMFEQIALFYEPEIEFTIRNLTSLLEPVMLLGMGLVVAFIALSVLLPIFNLISIVRR